MHYTRANDSRVVFVLVPPDASLSFRLCRKIAFSRQNPKIVYWKINDLRVQTFLFSVICDRAQIFPVPSKSEIAEAADQLHNAYNHRLNNEIELIRCYRSYSVTGPYRDIYGPAHAVKGLSHGPTRVGTDAVIYPYMDSSRLAS